MLPITISRLKIKMYAVGMATYITTNCYLDGKNKLNDYRKNLSLTNSYACESSLIIHNRNNKLDEFDKKYLYRSEMEAAQRGSLNNFPMYLITSLIWPITFPITILPHIILKNNKIE
jgi:hypothetical protein